MNFTTIDLLTRVVREPEKYRGQTVEVETVPANFFVISDLRLIEKKSKTQYPYPYIACFFKVSLSSFDNTIFLKFQEVFTDLAGVSCLANDNIEVMITA